jgi:hypothetical protein
MNGESGTAVRVERQRGHWCLVRISDHQVLARYTSRRRAAEHADRLG